MQNTLPQTYGLEYQISGRPTEFQTFVADSTGKMLPIFGEWLFENVPSTFSPTDRSPVPADYRIGGGDELQVTLWGQVNFSSRFIVDQTGSVTLPGIGPVAVAGLRSSEAASTFKAALSRVYRDFEVSVTVGGLRSIQIFVVGEARRPGAYMVSAFSTLVNAVFASGGPSPHGSMREIQLKRGDKVIRSFDLYDLLVRGDKSEDSSLQPGDLILIPVAGPRVALTGSVARPAIYELKAGSTLGETLAVAGGLSPVAAAGQVLLERVSPSGSLEASRIPLTEAGMASKLRNGDIVRVLPVVPRFRNTVTLRGNVADPGRFPWHEGMRVSELIPDRASLLTRDYWNERNRLTDDSQAVAQTGRATDELRQRLSNATSLDSRGSALIPQERFEQAGLFGSRQSSREEQRRSADTHEPLLPMGAEQQEVPRREFLPRNGVQPPAPEINWDYAVVERLDPERLTTSVLPFDLGRAVLLRDPGADVILQPGDVVTIFSLADFPTPRERQPKLVRLEGEVSKAGTYTLLPGETLHQLLERAGGLTPEAYLYGAQFTRDSARREQQKRMEEFLSQLETAVNQSAATVAGRVTSSEQATAAQASITGQREMIARLRQAPVTGRVVLNLRPDSEGVKAVPDIPLENGDAFVIPSRPATVNVIGAVASQATFLHEVNLQLGDYLRKAGGATRFADRSHMFVIRADGSVVSRGNRPAKVSRSFDALRMFPGDTLVVPSYISKTTVLRSLIDWSQVFSNLAIGAAAVGVLKNF